MLCSYFASKIFSSSVLTNMTEKASESFDHFLLFASYLSLAQNVNSSILGGGEGQTDCETENEVMSHGVCSYKSRCFCILS